MNKSASLDLTTGSIPRLLVRFSIPFLIANLLQSVYSLVDMVIVGQLMGSIGLAGVSTASTVTSLFTTIGTGLSMGGQIILAQFQGAGDKQGQKETIGTMFTSMLIMSVVIPVVCFLAGHPLLALMNTPEEAYTETWNYFIVCACGTIFIFGYNAVCAVLRGMGDSTRPMIFVGIASVVNIVLDILFVGPLNWGAGGAAAATALSQGVSFACSLVYLLNRKEGFVFDFKPASFRIIGKRLKMILKVGVPLALQFSVLMISMMFVMSIVNGFGVTAAAAYGVGGKISGFATIPVYAFSSAASTMVGQNIGAGNIDRAKSTIHWTVGMLLVIEGIIFLLTQLFPGPMVRLFNNDPGVVEIGIQYLRIMAFTYIAHCLLDGFGAVANGVGYSMLALISVAFDGVVLRVGLSYLFAIVLDMGITGVFIGGAIAPFGAGAICAIYFFSGRWKKRSLVEKA